MGDGVMNSSLRLGMAVYVSNPSYSGVGDQGIALGEKPAKN
jgi:hypothetical protein